MTCDNNENKRTKVWPGLFEKAGPRGERLALWGIYGLRTLQVICYCRLFPKQVDGRDSLEAFVIGLG